MRGRIGPALILAFVALAGCGDDDDVRSDGTGSAPATQLTVEVRPASDQARRQGTVTCNGSEASGTGFLATDPAGACRAVLSRDGRRRLVEGAEPDRLCTQIYGGPEEATVTGTLEGRRVDTSFDRKDGCGVAEWDDLEALLGEASAAAQPAY